ncbi:MAG: hypothetical protein A2Y97_01485 [Nitrospirae bacterium RBG_13_39_12]|nr:MAG: hypothetical protein A2Y97_01485 [Nitrospirae bacterium RBG_13_39_12]
MRKRVLIIFCLIVLLISFFYSHVLALQEETHRAININIAERTINGFSLDTYLIHNLGFIDGYKQKFGGVNASGGRVNQSIAEWLGYGGIQEDRPGSITDYIQNKPTRSVNHFHNPLKYWSEAGLNEFLGFYTGQSSVLWSQNPNQHIGGKWSWSDARNYFYSALTSTNKTQRNEYFARTFRAVGQLMHLVQDASVPEHVRNDAHVLPAYEAYVEKMRPTFWNNWINNPIFDKSNFNIPTVSSAPVPISRIIDTDLYNGQNPEITTNSGIGIAEYTNANFLSRDTMFTDDLYSSHRHYAPYPKGSNAILWTDSSNNRRYLRKVGDGDAITHLAIASILYNDRLKYFPQYNRFLPVGLDDKCYEKYASLLIPRAVGYSAGLLNYFFRGDIEVIPDDGTGSGYVIVNNTDEDMSGTFELWYDNKNDDRVKAWSSYLSIHKKSSGNNKSTNIIFTPPTNAKEDGKYMLVFRGKLGNEENAVAGRSLKFDFKDDEYLFFVSAAPYGHTQEGYRTYITAILPFDMIPENSAYTLTPVDSFTLNGTRYFDGYYTSSLVINNNSTKDKHEISYVMQDVGRDESGHWGSGIEWQRGEALHNYGLRYYNSPPTGRFTSLTKINNFSYGIYAQTDIARPWAASRRGHGLDYIYQVFDYTPSMGGGPYRYVHNDEIIVQNIGLDPSAFPEYWDIIPWDSYIERNTVIALLDTKALRVLYAYDTNIELGPTFSACGITDHTFRITREGKQELYFGDTLVKSLDYSAKSMWGNWRTPKLESYSSLISGCEDAYWEMMQDAKEWSDSAQQEYTHTLPDGRLLIQSTLVDSPMEVIDFDHTTLQNGSTLTEEDLAQGKLVDDELFVMFYKIKRLSTPLEAGGFLGVFPIEYYLVYRTQPHGVLKEVKILETMQWGDRLFGVSCQLNGDNIVYSYLLQHNPSATHYDYDWQTEKMVVGIINITDSNLPNGYIQEFEYTPLEETDYPTGLTLSSVPNGNLVPDTYTYHVSALNPVNQTLASSATSITMTGDEGGVMLRWNAVDGATHYVVYGRKGDVTALAIVGDTTWTDIGGTSLTAESKSHWTVAAIDAPWHLPESPIKPFLSAIGIHKKAN